MVRAQTIHPISTKKTARAAQPVLDPVNAAMRLRSGKVDSTDPLVSFLYTLIRDNVTPGRIEEIMQRHMTQAPGEITEFCNGYLAAYAQDVAARIRALESKTSRRRS